MDACLSIDGTDDGCVCPSGEQPEYVQEQNAPTKCLQCRSSPADVGTTEDPSNPGGTSGGDPFNNMNGANDDSIVVDDDAMVGTGMGMGNGGTATPGEGGDKVNVGNNDDVDDGATVDVQNSGGDANANATATTATTGQADASGGAGVDASGFSGTYAAIIGVCAILIVAIVAAIAVKKMRKDTAIANHFKERGGNIAAINNRMYEQGPSDSNGGTYAANDGMLVNSGSTATYAAAPHGGGGAGESLYVARDGMDAETPSALYEVTDVGNSGAAAPSPARVGDGKVVMKPSHRSGTGTGTGVSTASSRPFSLRSGSGGGGQPPRLRSNSSGGRRASSTSLVPDEYVATADQNPRGMSAQMYASPSALPTMDEMAAADNGNATYAVAETMDDANNGGAGSGVGAGLEAEYVLQSALAGGGAGGGGGANSLYAVAEPAAPTESMYVMQDGIDDASGLYAVPDQAKAGAGEQVADMMLSRDHGRADRVVSLSDADGAANPDDGEFC